MLIMWIGVSSIIILIVSLVVLWYLVKGLLKGV